MVRQYRIDRLNGSELLTCEVFGKHQFTQAETEAYLLWLDDHRRMHVMPSLCTQVEFRSELHDYLEDESKYDESGNLVAKFYGLDSPIPVYDGFPRVVIRATVVPGSVRDLSAFRIDSVNKSEFVEEIRLFMDFVSGPHWRNTVSHQRDMYGSLFEPGNDS